MEDKEETRVCGRCKKEVAEANFALHESHCSRFLRLCPDCDENVPRSELEQHRQEQHAQVKCPKCRKKMERRLLPEHEEEECPERVQPCAFCELDMSWAQLQEHVVACGSRTERCPDCGRYVKLSDRETHDRACSGRDQDQDQDQDRDEDEDWDQDQDQDRDLYNEPTGAKGAHGPWKTPARKGKVLCKVCKGSFPVDEIQKHEMRCTAAPMWNFEDSDSDDSDQASGEEYLSAGFRNLDLPRTVGAAQPRGAARSQAEDPHELLACPHCDLLLPLVTLRRHVVKCKVHVYLQHREGAV